MSGIVVVAVVVVIVIRVILVVHHVVFVVVQSLPRSTQRAGEQTCDPVKFAGVCRSVLR